MTTLPLLTDDDLDRVHDAALWVLSEVGVRIMTEEGLALLAEHGGRLEGEVVRIPPELVERALDVAPARFAIFDRAGDPALHLGEGNVYVGAGVTNLNYLDPRTGEVEDFSLRATAESTRLADALAHIDFVATPGVTRSSDELPLHIVNQCEFVEMVTNTTKPLMVLIAGGPELSDIYDMAELVAGGPDALRERPFVVPYLNSVSPLTFNPETVDKLFVAADRGLPVCCQAAPQVGATGPATIAGTLVISAAETLMGLVLAQLRAPGVPFISGTVPFLMDMRSGNVTTGGPDGFRFMVAMGQLCRRWGLPSVGMSFGGDSKLMDEQAALESAFYGLGAMLGGVDLVFDAGVHRGGIAVLARAARDRRRAGRHDPDGDDALRGERGGHRPRHDPRGRAGRAVPGRAPHARRISETSGSLRSCRGSRDRRGRPPAPRRCASEPGRRSSRSGRNTSSSRCPRTCFRGCRPSSRPAVQRHPRSRRTCRTLTRNTTLRSALGRNRTCDTRLGNRCSIH